MYNNKTSTNKTISNSFYFIFAPLQIAFNSMQIENYWNTENGTIVTHKSLNITSKKFDHTRLTVVATIAIFFLKRERKRWNNERGK